MYQQSPIEGEQIPAVRHDCLARFQRIADSLKSWEGKTVLDFGCAEGFFGIMFLKQGAKSCTFVDFDPECLKVAAERVRLLGLYKQARYYEKMDGETRYDIGLCLDLWSEPDVPNLEQFSKQCNVLFVSTSGEGNQKNGKLALEATKHFKTVDAIYTGYAGRTIYRCIP